MLGVVPYVDITLPSEDSLSLFDKRASSSPVRIGIIRLPRIANYTDFESLERSASVTYVTPGESLESYDCIIIPGTKNTVLDLMHLREAKTIEEIHKARIRGIPIIGICGGYQMSVQALSTGASSLIVTENTKELVFFRSRPGFQNTRKPPSG